MKRFQDNIQLKLLSVFLATLLWFYVQGREVSEMAIRYGIIFTGMSENLYIDSSSSPEVVAWIKASKNLLKRYAKNDMKIEINLRNYKEGRYTIDISEETLNLPKSVEITRIHPNKVHIRLARYLEKKVRVIPDYNNRRKISIDPPYVKIKGDRKTLSNIDSIYTEDFTEIKEKTFYIKLLPPAEGIKIEPEKVKITVH